ncbi:hypothetical protein Z517_07876 [Fonsecaea pedrosoi CBS 271.37]|uniref:Uncharacterized protein n=1 Tax=Fonsecaea pedrosoi CBS 271.37 TaxID=1442368 RepID=A0A0D2GBQ4_9EURO|nr:uncharacterized protein Z517_07876 [Fonsecaea pedrosoi CBS 271.37]KIW78043.1 hypothetical protein Z517_07876 [Fonsecaea pedrosoi CBS 271.37]
MATKIYRMICLSLFFLCLAVADAAWIEARSNPTLLTPLQAHGQLMKRDLSTPSNSCLPALEATSCDGLTGCAAYCCPADQECCNALGCRPKDSVKCVTGYATDGWQCCGTSWQYPASQGAICCGGSQGYWCPAGYQCVKHLIVQYSCCTDDSCNVYWNGTDAVTVSSSSSSTTTSPSEPSLPPATTISTLPETVPPGSTTPPSTTSKKSTSSSKTSSVAPTSTPTTCNPSGPQPTFVLQQTASTAKENGTYALLSKVGGGRDKISFGGTAANATTFTFNQACGLVGSASKEVANLHPPVNATGAAMTLFFDVPTNITAMGYTTATFDVADSALVCKVQNVAETWFSCNGILAVGAKAGSGCVKIGLTPQFVKG